MVKPLCISLLRFADEVQINTEVLVEEYGQLKMGKIKKIFNFTMQGKDTVY